MPRPTLRLDGQCWLMAGDESLGGPGRIQLLALIEQTGSIRQAALAMGMSYPTAWKAVQRMGERLGVSLVERLTGGKGGGGAQLTAEGRALVALFHDLEQAHHQALARLDARLQRRWPPPR